MNHLCQPTTWQNELAQAITQPQALWEHLRLDPRWLPAAIKAHQLFPLKVPRAFLAKIKPGDLKDPLLRQIVPLGAEHATPTDFITDPLQERIATPIPGLLHKYQGRILLTLTSACAINCRFCFRRHFPYDENTPGTPGWPAIFEYLTQRPDIHEVILSGGDPLSLPNRHLAKFSQQLTEIPHIKTLRFHTRFPIMIPSRIDQEFIDYLANLPLRKVLILHCNHPQEIDETLIKALHSLRTIGVTLLNQTVLLRSINDDAILLQMLSERLLDAGILPYYLHQLDKVQGTAHFAVTDERAIQLHQHLRHHLPGYLVPRLVREIPNECAKAIISSSRITN